MFSGDTPRCDFIVWVRQYTVFVAIDLPFWGENNVIWESLGSSLPVLKPMKIK